MDGKGIFRNLFFQLQNETVYPAVKWIKWIPKHLLRGRTQTFLQDNIHTWWIVLSVWLARTVLKKLGCPDLIRICSLFQLSFDLDIIRNRINMPPMSVLSSPFQAPFHISHRPQCCHHQCCSGVELVDFLPDCEHLINPTTGVCQIL